MVIWWEPQQKQGKTIEWYLQRIGIQQKYESNSDINL